MCPNGGMLGRPTSTRAVQGETPRSQARGIGLAYAVCRGASRALLMVRRSGEGTKGFLMKPALGGLLLIGSDNN